MLYTHLTQSVSRGQQREPLQPEVNTAGWDVPQIKPLFTQTEGSLNTHFSQLADFFEDRRRSEQITRRHMGSAMWHANRVTAVLLRYFPEWDNIRTAFLCLQFITWSDKILNLVQNLKKVKHKQYYLHHQQFWPSLQYQDPPWPWKRDRYRGLERESMKPRIKETKAFNFYIMAQLGNSRDGNDMKST